MRLVLVLVLLSLSLAALGCGKDSDDLSDAGNCGDPGTRCGVDSGTPPDGDAQHSAQNTGSTSDAADLDAGSTDVAPPEDTGREADAAPGCGRVPAAADRARKVVVARPFTGTEYEVFDLSETGELSRPGVSFSMGSGQQGTIQFTPDGEVGFVAQKDGTIGVFRFSQSGQPEVLEAAFDPGFYVSGILIDPSGDVLWGWETGFRDVGGALFRMELACASGMPAAAEEFAPAKLLRGAQFLDANTIAVSAVDLLDDESPNGVHLLDLAGPTRLASAPAFPDTEAIAAGFAVTADGRHALVGDNSAFSQIPNRLGIVRIDGDSLTTVGTIDLHDPVAIVTSPFDDVAIVLSTTGDAIQVLSYDAEAGMPFELQGPLPTQQPTLLPLSVATIDRGTLRGRVLVGENVAVRQLQFEGNGTVTDLGLLELGPGIEQITGAIGIQP